MQMKVNVFRSNDERCSLFLVTIIYKKSVFLMKQWYRRHIDITQNHLISSSYFSSRK